MNKFAVVVVVVVSLICSYFGIVNQRVKVLDNRLIEAKTTAQKLDVLDNTSDFIKEKYALRKLKKCVRLQRELDELKLKAIREKKQKAIEQGSKMEIMFLLDNERDIKKSLEVLGNGYETN